MNYNYNYNFNQHNECGNSQVNPYGGEALYCQNKWVIQSNQTIKPSALIPQIHKDAISTAF
jgi:hypothetical protein